MAIFGATQRMAESRRWREVVMTAAAAAAGDGGRKEKEEGGGYHRRIAGVVGKHRREQH